MSGLTELILIPQVISDGYDVTLGRLHEEYHRAVAEFRTRAQDEQAQRAQQERAFAESTAAALALAEQTQVTAAEDATLAFLREHVQALAQQLETRPNAEAAAQLTELQQALQAPAGDLAAHFETYDRLFDCVMTSATRASEPVGDALRLLREEIASPLLDAPECRESREQLLAQLATLEGLADSRQTKSAAQGMALLRRRVHRALKEQVARRQEAAAVRDLTTDALAKLRTLAAFREFPPAYTRHAELLLARLRAELTAPSGDHLAALREIAGETDALFAATEKLLADRRIADYVGDSVREVLLTLGYRVSQIPADDLSAPKSFVAALDDGLGMAVQVDGSGRVQTEMVAFNAEAADVDVPTQERVCAMVDELVAALKARNWTLRERTRTHFEEGEQLKVVELPTTETAAISTPKVKRIDE